MFLQRTCLVRPSLNLAIPLLWGGLFSLSSGRDLAFEKRSAQADRERLDQGSDVVEARTGCLQACAKVAAAIDFKLYRVNAAPQVGMPLDDMAAGEGIVDAGRIA